MTEMWQSGGVVLERWVSNTNPGVVFTTVIREGEIVAQVSDEQIATAVAAYLTENPVGGVDLSDATPEPLGTAAPGVSEEASRSDHAHGLPTASDVGADAAGTASSAVSAHAGATDPHGDRAYADGLFAANDALVYKGAIDCSSNPNYPAASAGHTYRVSVAGKIGGALGPNVEVGDLLACVVDGTSAGNHATVGANWTIVQTNLDGAVIGPASATDGRIARFDGTTGKLIKGDLSFLDEDDMASDSATSVPSQQSVKAYVDAHAASEWSEVARFTTATANDWPTFTSVPTADRYRLRWFRTPTDTPALSGGLYRNLTITIDADTTAGNYYNATTSATAISIAALPQGGGGHGQIELFRTRFTSTVYGLVGESNSAQATSNGPSTRVAASHSYRRAAGGVPPLSTWALAASYYDAWAEGWTFILETAELP